MTWPNALPVKKIKGDVDIIKILSRAFQVNLTRMVVREV